MTFGNPVVGGNKLIRPAIQSPNYQSGTAGWTINRDGTAEFNSVTIRGTLESANYVPGVSGWRLDQSGTAELNQLTARGTVQSSNYVPGVSGWQVDASGTAEFGDATVRGVISTGVAPSARITLDDYVTLSSPAVGFYDGVNADPAFVYGFDDGNQTGVRMTTGHLAGSGTDGAELSLDSNGLYVVHEALADLLLGIVWDDDPEIGAVQALHPGGIAMLRSDGTYTSASVMVDGRVNTSSVTTAIGTSDTNIIAANAVNVPVIADRAYYVVVQLDYFRATPSAAGALARLNMKLWNGAVGGTQLGGTARIPMAGPLSTDRRTAVGHFVFRAASTTTIANLNVSLATTDTTVGQTWTAEVNQGYMILIHEVGAADNISNL